jgi:hypothetical protein
VSKAGITVESRKQLLERYYSSLSATFNVELSDGHITSSALKALAETLTYVPVDKVDEGFDDKMVCKTPSHMYAWAIANSSIVFPYLDLEVAEKNMKHAIAGSTSWGLLKNGKFRIPRPESILEDSTTWLLIREIIRANFPERLLEDYDIDETVPDLSNDTVALKPAINEILIRILQLARNPLSCTIRRSDMKRGDTLSKNAVDFIALEWIWQKDDYKGLTLSGKAVSEGRRKVKTEQRTGNIIKYVNIYTGYMLSNLLADYIPKRTAKSLESEPFIDLIVGIIRELMSKISDEELSSFELPKSFFETPSYQLRNGVREGPQIKTKNGLRHNLYVPLSFVKAAECAPYPEAFKRETIDVGAQVLVLLDQINKYSVKETCKRVGFFKDYLAASYLISDVCRKEWRHNAYVASPEALRKHLVSDFPSQNAEYSALQEYLDNLRGYARRIVFSPVSDDSEIQRAVQAQVSQIIQSKKPSRASAR